MAKKEYKWLARLIDKITKNDCPNNNYFWYYGREVNLQSGMSDFMDVTISEDDRGWRRNQITFNFDFCTKELVFEGYNNYDERDAIIKAFRNIYGHISIDDEPLDSEINHYKRLSESDKYDQEDKDYYMREYNELLSRRVA